MTVCLACDGSVNGDWIARFAVRLAAGAADKRLRILHVETAELAAAELARKVDNIQFVADRAGVDAELEIVPMRDGVVGGLVQHLGSAPTTIMVCGVRVRGGRRGFLTNTVSWQLLRDTHFDVVALRVVQPGALGVVRRLLMPVAGHRPGRRTAQKLLELMAHDLERLRLLYVVEQPAPKLRRMDAAAAEAARRHGAAALADLEAALRDDPVLDGVRLETGVRIADDWAREAVIDAAQHHSDMICLEASRDSLARGFRYSDPFETMLRDAVCDTAIYRGGVANGG